MPFPNQTFSTIQQLLTYINTYFIPNGLREIDGEEGNNILNGLANFIINYTLNGQFANIDTATGTVRVLAKPITVFTGAPTSIQWVDNIQNEYYIVNATGFDIPLTSGYSYIDQYQTALTVIPSRTSIHIAKATNGSWVQLNNIGGGSGTSLPPQTGHDGEVLISNGNTAFWGSTFIKIKSADFESDGITYLNPILLNNQFDIFFNELGRFLYNETGNVEFTYELTGGFRVLIPGFNASSSNYTMYIFLRGLN